MSGLIGKKIGMTSVFGADGKNIPCTVIEAGPLVTQLKTPEKDGYSAVQIAYDETTEKHTSNSLLGHFKKANTTPKRKLVEFTSFEKELNLGDSGHRGYFRGTTTGWTLRASPKARASRAL